MKNLSFYYLQKKMIEILKGISDIDVFDYVPENAKFPYIRIGNFTNINWDTKLKYGDEITVNISVFSKYKGNSEAFEIMNKITNKLTNIKEIERFNLVKSNLEYSEIFLDSDGKTRHGVLRYRFLIEEI